MEFPRNLLGVGMDIFWIWVIKKFNHFKPKQLFLSCSYVYVTAQN